jgi:hypothetical protein
MLICVRAITFFSSLPLLNIAVAFVLGKIKNLLLCRPAPTRGEPCRSLVLGYVLLYIFILKTINILKREMYIVTHVCVYIGMIGLMKDTSCI